MGPLICSVRIFNFCINKQFLGVLFKLVGMKLRASGNHQDPLLLAAAAPTPILYCLLRALLPVIRDFICIPYCVLQIVVNCNVSFFIQIHNVFFQPEIPLSLLTAATGKHYSHIYQTNPLPQTPSFPPQSFPLVVLGRAGGFLEVF